MIFVLTGLKHCGKSTVARGIAQRTGGVLFDIDDEIVRMTGQTPRGLYKTAGAAAFGKAEYKACCDVADKCSSLKLADAGSVSAVIATGGGICDNTVALDVLRSVGTVVFLDVPFDIAWNRIERDAQITGEYPAYLQTPDPKETFRGVYGRRRNIYLQNSDKILDIQGEDTADVIAAVLRS